MSVIEVHPEELLDRELRGTLNVSERALLNAHLERCTACRLERRLRADFQHELAVPAYVSDDLTDVIAGAMRACEQPASASAGASVATEAAESVPGMLTPAVSSLARPRACFDEPRRVAGVSPPMRRVAMLLVACTVLSVGVGYAGAQLGLAERSFGALLEQVGLGASKRLRRTRAVSVPRAKLAPAPLHASLGAAAVSTPALMPEPAAAVAAPSEGWRHLVADTRERPAERRQRAKRAQASSSSRAPGHVSLARRSARSDVSSAALTPRTPAPPVPAALGVEPVVASSAPAPAAAESVSLAAPAPAPESAARLFERANRVRHRGAVGDAGELYAELRSRYPDSAEARLSLAVVARMQLDQGELRAALTGFEAYLNSADRALHEEAMVGRIRALSRLDREDDAVSAARALLKAHPRSAFAAEAEALIERAERD